MQSKGKRMKNINVFLPFQYLNLFLCIIKINYHCAHLARLAVHGGNVM